MALIIIKPVPQKDLVNENRQRHARQPEKNKNKAKNKNKKSNFAKKTMPLQCGPGGVA
jgi:hypothetical protein